MLSLIAAILLKSDQQPTPSELYCCAVIPCIAASSIAFLNDNAGHYGDVSQAVVASTVQFRAMFVGQKLGELWQLMVNKRGEIGRTGHLYSDALLAFGNGVYHSHTVGHKDHQLAHDYYLIADRILFSGGATYAKPPYLGLMTLAEVNVILSSMELRRWNLDDFEVMQRHIDRCIVRKDTRNLSLMLGTILTYTSATENLTDKRFLFGLFDVCKKSIPRLMTPEFRKLENVNEFLILAINVASMTAEVDAMLNWYDAYVRDVPLTRTTAYHQALAATALILTTPDEAVTVGNQIIKYFEKGPLSADDARALCQAVMVRSAAQRALGMSQESIYGIQNALRDERWKLHPQQRALLTAYAALLKLGQEVLSGSTAKKLNETEKLLGNGTLERQISDFALSMKSSTYQALQTQGAALLEKLGENSYADLAIREIMLRSSIIHEMITSTEAAVRLLDLRSSYLQQWQRSIVPRARIGFVQEAQGNPMTRFGIDLATLDKQVDGFETVEAGRGWTALAATVKSPNKRDTFKVLAAVPRLKKFQDWLKAQPKTTLGLSFAMYEDSAPGVFIVTPTAMQYKPIEATYEELTKLCNDWNAAIRGSGPYATAEELSLAPKEKELATKIETLVFGPVREAVKLPDYKRLLVSPDGPLRHIPLRALADSSGVRFVDQFHISIAPALRLYPTYGSQPIVLDKVTAPPDANIEIQSDLSTEPVASGISDLPDMEKVSKNLSVSFKSAHQLGFFGTPMSKDVVIGELQKAHVIHFYNHCSVNPRSALDSSLLLNTTTGVPERLTAMEISNLTLKARLATLWSCGTADGKSGGGDGVIGMAWAFQAAGVPTQIASHWDVLDCVGAKIMERFYFHALNGDEDLDIALDHAIRDHREALRANNDSKIRARADQPYFWAPYDLFGDFRKL